MIRTFFLKLLLVSCTFTVVAQTDIDKEQILWSIDQFVEGTNNSDTTAIRRVVDSSIGLLTIFNDGKKNIMTAETLEMLFEDIIKPRIKLQKEEQEGCIVETNSILASVWCNYKYLVNNKISHCGVNAYQLYKTKRGWKIIQMTDTRQKHNCR